MTDTGDTGYTIEQQGPRTYYRSKIKPTFVTPHLHLMEKHLASYEATMEKQAPPPPPPKKAPAVKTEEKSEK